MLRQSVVCVLCLLMLSGCAWVGRLLGGGDDRAPVERAQPAVSEASARSADPPSDFTPERRVPTPAEEPRAAVIDEQLASEAVPASPAPVDTAPTVIEPGTTGAAQDLVPIGAAAFEQLKAKSRLSADFRMHSLVRCVATRLISALPDDERLRDWEVLVFDEPGAFAFVLPGARLGVHAELLSIARTENQLAGALSHLLAHQRLAHVSQRMVASIPLEDAEVAVHVLNGAASPTASRTTFAALGLGHRVGRALPFSAAHEAETDLAALEILLGAGYRPDDARAWWHALVAADAPLWLAQHPAPAARLAAIKVVSGTENVKPKVWCAE